MKRRTYLFDFDGTLVDSMPTYVAAMLHILDENGVPYTPELVGIITPLGVVGTAEYFIKMGLALSREQIIEQMKHYMLDAYFHHIEAKPGVIHTLQTLSARGDRLNILTASPHITLDACLTRLGIYDLFDHVFSCDDFSTTKADVQLYRTVADVLGRRTDEVLFLDDNFNAVCCAKRAGMKTCGVYDASSADDEERMRATCDGYLYEMQELLQLEF